MGEENIREDICAPVIEQGTERMRSNQELWELYKDLDIVTDIKNKIQDSNG
jgi:hypothetical protein